ncbi:SDR family NAD(P)-dependent oxidoreductase [Mucilaginibacter jinjuensis]|uniref:SDR family NAD(P)-dependent oxidoreductase n=1 Tax=Mucilaginibacter jinjuensis TaxID=1176721 RepID=A0ABY7TD82_9SPHI|nr:SDR family NAD(P)-dependent oxidoreductase [Mucilaginibacter jinjuensis]WCT14291.1 SDR family NAD(P)-dependent oxidoreductase [Mucilaginibacter jinjuensis]
MSKTIFITGASRGFGRIWAEQFLKRGDKVTATARNISSLKELADQYGENFLALELDVNDREAGFAAVKTSVEKFGTIDVLINNAGYGLFGTVEETSEKEAREQIETNFFGLLWLSQAVLPFMRKQKSGHIIQVSSVLGQVTLPVMGLYNASKFAVEGLSETLASEVKAFGINVTLVEPNGFNTEWAGASAANSQVMPEYEQVREGLGALLGDRPFGDPAATSEAILKLADSENPPLRLILGSVAYPWIQKVYQERLAEWEEWKEVSSSAQGN